MAVKFAIKDWAVKKEIVVVTGASAGLGRAIAREFGKHGANVALIARGIDGLKAAQREIEELGGRALILPLDVADSKAVETAAATVEEQLGPIDIWVNVAFVGALRFFWDTSDSLYRRITDVTYMGYVNGTRAALTLMRRDRKSVV